MGAAAVTHRTFEQALLADQRNCTLFSIAS
jgi:hypothetical protein